MSELFHFELNKGERERGDGACGKESGRFRVLGFCENL